jgi:hypothetical protein
LQELYHPLLGQFVAGIGLLRGSLADLLCILFIVLGEVTDECFLLFLQSQECVPDFFRQCVTVHVHHACVKSGIEVQCLPGATAFVPALVASGLPDERFCFEGFLPQKKGRVTRLTSLQEEKRTMIFYESPYRLVKTLTQFAEFFGAERPVSVCREISKIHEESVRGTLTEVIAHFTQNEPRGEIVIVLGGKED